MTGIAYHVDLSLLQILLCRNQLDDVGASLQLFQQVDLVCELGNTLRVKLFQLDLLQRVNLEIWAQHSIHFAAATAPNLLQLYVLLTVYLQYRKMSNYCCLGEAYPAVRTTTRLVRDSKASRDIELVIAATGGDDEDDTELGELMSTATLGSSCWRFGERL